MTRCFDGKVGVFQQTVVKFIISLNVLSESSIHFASILTVFTKKMLVSIEMIFMEKEPALLCVIMRECGKTSAATI